MIGSEVTSAFWKSSSNHSLSALPALASPNSSTRKSGWASRERGNRRKRRLDQVLGRDLRVVARIGTPNLISADVPSCEIAPSVPAE